MSLLVLLSVVMEAFASCTTFVLEHQEWVDHALRTAATPLVIRPTFTGPPAKTTPLAGHSFVVHFDRRVTR